MTDDADREQGGTGEQGAWQQGEGQQNRQGGGAQGQGQTMAERAVAIVSVAVTLALLGFVAWQAWTVPPVETPNARVTGTATLPDGTRAVTVVLVNDQDVGVMQATVEVGCGSPPPQVTFEHVPAGGRATAHVTCPPGSGDPNATVVTWQEP